MFEKGDGGEHVVSSDELGQALATARVPLFVLNACQSAQEESGADPFSSVAAQLVATGAKGVVAMTYSVYAAAAADFMQRFYERLVQGVPLAEAVAAGRQRLFTAPDRDSVVGPLPLRDWIVPALYQQELNYVPIPTGASAPTEGEGEDEARRLVEEACAEGPFGFIGRDYDLLRIDARCVIRHPVGLAHGHRRGRQDHPRLRLRPLVLGNRRLHGGVFFTSFREKADFGQVIGSMVGYRYGLLPAPRPTSSGTNSLPT